MGNSTNFIERSLLYPQHGRQSLSHWYVGNRTNFIERSLFYPQHVGRSWSRMFDILYIQCEISSSTNSTCWPFWNLTQKHIFWKFSQKPKYIKPMDDNLQGCRNKKQAWQKTGTKNKWVGDGVVIDYHALGRGTRISDNSGNKLWQLRLHTKKKNPLFIRPQLITDEHQQLDCGNTTLTCFTSNATLTYPSQLTVR